MRLLKISNVVAIMAIESWKNSIALATYSSAIIELETLRKKLSHHHDKPHTQLVKIAESTDATLVEALLEILMCLFTQASRSL